MDREVLRSLLPQAHLLSDDAVALLQPCLTVMELPKNTLLIQDTRVERNAYLLYVGIARAYISTAAGEITFGFAREGHIINANAGYFSKTKGYENFHLLEDAQLLKIDLDCIQQLFLVNIEICNWARVITEMEAMAAEERQLDYILLSPEERYVKLLQNDASLLHRVPLKNIATYLGISPVSLSRIRARIK